MTLDLLIALTLFALVSSITPGPNNLMLMTSGVNFGFKRTIPHMLGVALGFTLMVGLVGIGLAQIFDIYPISYDILKVCSVAYLLFLAYKIANAAAPHSRGNASGKPFTFIQAALFQWVNPKGWTMALTASAVYSPTHTITASALVALVFGLVNLPCISMWTLLGTQVKALLINKRRLTAFNYTMAFLLVLSLFPVIFN
ncbi:MAG: threonine/homoserine/homoserine lactone efflux protein [Pseudohongiellaceae bacterium]|jgi:threonine/homoserine/homoserine lactone efflux protein